FGENRWFEGRPAISADGRVLSLANGAVIGRRGRGYASLKRARRDDYKGEDEVKAGGPPGPGGKGLYSVRAATEPRRQPLSSTGGMASAEGRVLARAEGATFLPALHGPLCFTAGEEVRVHLGGQAKPLVSLPTPAAARKAAGLWLVPAADVLVCLDEGRKRV